MNQSALNRIKLFEEELKNQAKNNLDEYVKRKEIEIASSQKQISEQKLKKLNEDIKAFEHEYYKSQYQKVVNEIKNENQNALQESKKLSNSIKKAAIKNLNECIEELENKTQTEIKQIHQSVEAYPDELAAQVNSNPIQNVKLTREMVNLVYELKGLELLLEYRRAEEQISRDMQEIQRLQNSQH